MAFECPIPIQDYDRVTLVHGGGGKLTQKLIKELFEPLFDNPFLNELHDGATLPPIKGKIAFTTDSFVVNPIFFPGGNIGSLAVNGTVNDLAMCGAKPLYVSLSLIIEEGLRIKDLWDILVSVRESADRAGVTVVTGDTKVVEKGKGDGIFITTTGVGELMEDVAISPSRIQKGDLILINDNIAEHGIAIMSCREGISFETKIESDSRPLWPLVEEILKVGRLKVHVLRDATRGGLSSVLNELAQSSNLGIVVHEEKVPVRDEVKGACEILGLDPMFIANEGVFVAFVSNDIADKLLDIMRSHPMGKNASIIGEVVEEHPGMVTVKTIFGARRVLDMISGEQLPRIC